MQVKLFYIRLFNSFSAFTNIEAILITKYFTLYEGSLSMTVGNAFCPQSKV